MKEKLELLKKNDPILGQFIDVIGTLELTTREDHYLSLVNSIIGQQLSVKAAGTIFNRFVELTNHTVTPEIVLGLSDDQLREIGVSRPKISYIRDLSQKVSEKKLRLDTLEELPNEEAMLALTAIKGIGNWTAEMFLIFSLGRENILSHLDVGLHRGAKWLYDSEDGKTTLIDKGKNWEPYQSLASLYLWEVVNRGLVTKYASFTEYQKNL
ncbi:DNA-3-methyladenine glycosylase 2 family protein [Bacillus luteolus]|uniref:DNA-3-methyladenine glycosylase II n=1 Tax=Litchfieldia luteola TaxID=682179 RepID=A0ABR9QGP9_9BACI|nr:DNA-3-methyladenine glycosylase 2 family protein [Cytobacillus luteolus]MBE4907674.1 DNA-3-methyladenine glycosylase 2 family protein [Cytobacillus luteolus]MBP1941125.1 DNA-3-methyladenine glycosylase II [Cytobacillus luteolus]